MSDQTGVPTAPQAPDAPQDGPTSVEAAAHIAPNDAPTLPRRQPGEPHPYMLQRNPPNLWILVVITIFSLVLAAVIMVLTVLL